MYIKAAEIDNELRGHTLIGFLCDISHVFFNERGGLGQKPESQTEEKTIRMCSTEIRARSYYDTHKQRHCSTSLATAIVGQFRKNDNEPTNMLV